MEHKAKILLADDNPAIRMLVSEILTDAGFSVVTAEDGQDALDKIYKENPDLLILDEWLIRRLSYNEAYDLLAYRAKYDVKMSLRYLNRIIEYAKFQNAETITRDVVDDALELAGLGTYFEDIEEDNDEMMQVFREINDSLTSIKEDVSFMRSRMEDFLDANGIL